MSFRVKGCTCIDPIGVRIEGTQGVRVRQADGVETRYRERERDRVTVDCDRCGMQQTEYGLEARALLLKFADSERSNAPKPPDVESLARALFVSDPRVADIIATRGDYWVKGETRSVDGFVLQLLDVDEERERTMFARVWANERSIREDAYARARRLLADWPTAAALPAPKDRSQ